MRFIILMLLMMPMICWSKPPCPSLDWLARTQFVEARQNPFDADQWHVYSSPRQFQQTFWQVEYGRFYFDRKPAEILAIAQQMFQYEVQFSHQADSVDIPGYWLCDYTGNGGSFWISAQTKRSCLRQPFYLF